MPVLIEVLADMVWNSTFPENEIDLERDVIGEEITMIRESPSDHIGDLLASALGRNIPSAKPSPARWNPSKKSPAPASAHSPRNTISGRTSSSPPPAPMPAGEILAALLPLLPKKFRKPPLRLGYTPSSSREIIEHPPHRPAPARPRLAHPGRHAEERHALRLLSLILGESSSSRLFTELREERGLCYQIGSETSLFHETGALQIVAGLDPDSREESLETIFRETEGLAANGPRPGELERAKRLAISQSKQAFESTAAHAAWAGEGLLFLNHIPSPQEARENLLKVTDEQIQSIAARIFSQQPATAEIRS